MRDIHFGTFISFHDSFLPPPPLPSLQQMQNSTESENVVGIILNETNCQIVSSRNRVSPGELYVEPRKKKERKETKERGTKRGRNGGWREKGSAFISTGSRVTNPFAFEHNFQSGRDRFATSRTSGLFLSRERQKGWKGRYGCTKKGAAASDRFSLTRLGSAKAVCRRFAVTAAAIRAAISSKRLGKIKIIVKHRNTALDAQTQGEERQSIGLIYNTSYGDDIANVTYEYDGS